MCVILANVVNLYKSPINNSDYNNVVAGSPHTSCVIVKYIVSHLRCLGLNTPTKYGGYYFICLFAHLLFIVVHFYQHYLE